LARAAKALLNVFAVQTHSEPYPLFSKYKTKFVILAWWQK